MRRVSMRDVASLAQVSIGTVSNVINTPEKVLPDTRKKVEDAIAELGWIPNRQARELRAGRGNTIGIAVMDVANPFFADVLRGAQSVLWEQGFVVTTGDADNSAERQSMLMRAFLEQRVRGVILGPIGGMPDDVVDLERAGIPTVLVDRISKGGETCTVGVDDVAGGRIAAKHLFDGGRRAIAFVGGPSSLAQVQDRREGARQVAEESGGRFLVISTPQLDIGSGRAAADELALMSDRERPDAVFCGNDLVAIGMLQGLIAHGFRVPEDIAIIGYDDIEFAAAAAIPLSSIAQPRLQLGMTAASLLLAEFADRDAGVPHVHQAVTFMPTLVPRLSSAPVVREPMG